MCFQPRNSHSCVVFDCSLLRLLRGGKVGVPSLTRHAWEAFKLLCNSSLTSTFRKNLCALMVDFHRFCHARRSAVQHTCLKVGHKLRKVVPFSSVFSWQARHSIAVCNTCFIRSLQFFFFFLYAWALLHIISLSINVLLGAESTHVFQFFTLEPGRPHPQICSSRRALVQTGTYAFFTMLLKLFLYIMCRF